MMLRDTIRLADTNCNLGMLYDDMKFHIFSVQNGQIQQLTPTPLFNQAYIGFVIPHIFLSLITFFMEFCSSETFFMDFSSKRKKNTDELAISNSLYVVFLVNILHFPKSSARIN